MRCDSERSLSQKLPLLYLALAFYQELGSFSHSEATILAQNFRFFLFSEIYDHERIGHFVSRKPCHILIQGLIASYRSFPPFTPYRGLLGYRGP